MRFFGLCAAMAGMALLSAAAQAQVELLDGEPPAAHLTLPGASDDALSPAPICFSTTNQIPAQYECARIDAAHFYGGDCKGKGAHGRVTCNITCLNAQGASQDLGQTALDCRCDSLNWVCVKAK